MESSKLNLITKTIGQLESEEWRPIGIYESRYWVSNYGRVCSVIHRKPKLMSQHLNNKGYLRVALSLEKDHSKRYLVHRLVAEAFLVNNNLEQKTTVHHKNHNKQDNSVQNLEYLSLADNIRESILYRKAKRKSNGEE